ncbi:hypothetical protein FoTM2_017332, partial [Fusarium oxysporum f. sp. vasinfectum]
SRIGVMLEAVLVTCWSNATLIAHYGGEGSVPAKQGRDKLSL